MEVRVGEEFSGGVVGFAFGDAVFVGDGGGSTGFVVGVGGERWWAIGGNALELEAGGPGEGNGFGAGIGGAGAQAVGIVLIADGAGGAAGEGLGFRGQVVPGVVGIVAF